MHSVTLLIHSITKNYINTLEALKLTLNLEINTPTNTTKRI